MILSTIITLNKKQKKIELNSKYKSNIQNNQHPKMYLPSQSSSSSSLTSPKTYPTTNASYKQRANLLFQKLNTFKTSLQNQKHEKFSELLNELKSMENSLEATSCEKNQHYEKVLSALNQLDQQTNQQKIQFNRFKKILENLIQSTTRECAAVFDKMTKQSQNNQLAITKYIDFKVEAFVLKNKGVWHQQDMLNFQPFKQQLNYLKKQVQQFYKTQQKQTQKIKKQLSDQLDRQKQFLLNEMKRTDHEDLMIAVEGVCSDIQKRIALMTEKRENVEKNVLSMIENVVDSYIRDTKKFK